MLDSIFDFFERRFVESSPTISEFNEHDLQIASIAILIEMMQIDDEIVPVERKKLLEIICENFGLSSDEATALMAAAESKREQATDYFQFTRLINKGFDPEEKVKLIEYLWQVAFADGRLDLYEEHLVRKIAELLYVPHSDFIKMKLKVSGA